MANANVKIVGISGSLTPGGRNRVALDVALEAAVATGRASVEVIDLRERKIALADGRPVEDYGDDTAAAVKLIAEADAVIVSSPIYKASYPGALKNLFDHLPHTALEGKAVGIIAVGGSLHHYLMIDTQFRSMLAWFGAVVAPGSVYVQQKFIKDGAVTDETTHWQLRQLGEAIVDLARRLDGIQVLPPPLPGMWM